MTETGPGRMRLAELSSLHAHLVWVYRGEPPDYSRRSWVSAPFLSAYLMLDGNVTIRDKQGQLSGRAGQWVFPRQGRRWQEFSPGARLISVRFKAKWPTGEDLFERGLGIVLDAADAPELERAAWPLEQYVTQWFPDSRVDLMEANATLLQHLELRRRFDDWLIAVIETLMRAGLEPTRSGVIDDRVAQAVRLLERQPLNAGLSEAELAAQVGVSVSQLNRLFAKQFSTTSRQYFDRRRLHAAVMALETTPQSIKHLAFDLGFSSPPHFTTWFRTKTGSTPLEFRRNAQRQPLPDWDVTFRDRKA